MLVNRFKENSSRKDNFKEKRAYMIRKSAYQKV